MLNRTKKQKLIHSEVDLNHNYSLKDGIELLKKFSSSNFDETFDVAFRLGVDPRHADQMVKGVCDLPHGLGKTVRIAVFARSPLAEKAKEAGADIVGAEDLMNEILAGKIDFDRCVATPDMMPIVGRLGKVLGPRGLMPNPKTGTVTPNIVDAITKIKAGSVEFKCDKTGIVHAGLGKISFETEKLVDNFLAFLKNLLKSKPSGAKGNFLLKTSLSSTQGIGIGVDVKEFLS